MNRINRIINKEKFKDFFSILPFNKVISILGVYFTVGSIFYVIICYAFIHFDVLKNNDKYKMALWIAFGIIIFLSMWIILAIETKKNQDQTSVINRQGKIVNLKSNLDICLKCANEKSADGFHYHGLLTLDELKGYEETLANDTNPEDCLVLVYTSDLATEKDAEKQVKKNIFAGVKYIVLYFQNSCSAEELYNIEKLYGKENIINLSVYDKYNQSFDGKLAKTLGFDIMIYKNSNEEKHGFFAIDFVPEGSFRNETHTMDCKNKCNFGLEECQRAKLPTYKKDPFYKEISSERVIELYREIIKIYQDNRKDKIK